MMKNKALIGVVIAILVMASGGILVATQVLGSQQAAFTSGGFILSANDEAEAAKYVFSPNTKIKEKFPDQVTFKDIQGNPVTVSDDSFVHYDSNAVSALKPGVLVNLDEVGGQYINNYSIPSRMLLQKGSEGYTLETGKGPVTLSNFILKVSDERYILCSDKISLEFAPDDIRDASGFVEVKYIDHSVIQLITSENVWHTISLSAKARLANGTEFVFSENKLVGSNGELPLSTVLINSEDNIKVMAAAKAPEIKVPKFDIKTVDGENGEAGKDGESGNDGTPGELGKDGDPGTPGTPGEAGPAGEAGEAGQAGTQGSKGKTGAAGSSGSSGAAGADGLDGTTQGSSGGNGDVAEDVIAMPIFKITDWKVTATSVEGTIEVEDTRNLLVNMPGSIHIIEMGTGNVVTVLNELGDPTFAFENATVEFSCDTLQPDTQYRLVVTSDYTVDVNTYTRDFISRVFYTDSMGIMMSKGAIEEQAVTVDISKASYSLAKSVDVYLLTEAENASFNPGVPNTYIKASIDLNAQSDYSAKFSNLSHNTSYVVRMVTNRTITTQNPPVNEATVSNFELRVRTLKREPELGDPAVIQVISNGTFQLSLDRVNDPDNGIKTFKYEIYRLDGNTRTYVKTISSSTKDPATLFVDGFDILRNRNYVMKAIVEFDDNEKIVSYESAESDPFIMVSTSLPVVYFTSEGENPEDLEGHTFNSITGFLTIQKTSSSIEPNSTIRVILEIPGYFQKNLNFDNTKYLVTPQGDIRIPISEDGLKAGDQLRMSVWAKVDMNDGRGYEQRMVGSVVETLRDPDALNVQWLDGTGDTAIEKMVLFTPPTDTNGSPVNVEYEASTLGEVVISLYEGTGTNKKFLKSISEKNTNMASNTNSTLKGIFYDSPYLLNEEKFNMTAQQLQAASYTLEVTSIYDYTYDNTSPLYNVGNISGYKNAIPVVAGTQSVVVYKKNSPPPIASSGITVTPILNVQAAYYGGTVDPNLNGDTVIGFRATSQYDNYASLARYITYYAFDRRVYDAFVNPDPAGNPTFDQIRDNRACYQTEEIAINNRMSMPSVVFLMGGTAGYSRTLSDGSMVYYTGAWNGATGKGMQRGRQYYFAYTIRYSPDGGNEPTATYPYNAADYTAGTVIHTSVADAPRQQVQFTFYPWTSTANSYTWQYRYTDPDGALDPGYNFSWSNGAQNNNVSTHFTNGAGVWHPIDFGSGGNPLVPNNPLRVNTLQNLYVYGDLPTTLQLMSAPFAGLNTFNAAGITVEMDTGRMEQNLLDFDVSGPSTSIRRIAALELTFIKGAQQIKVYRALGDLEITGANATTRISMPLSMIAALSGQNGITVRARFLYDSGICGYNQITTALDEAGDLSKYFALQVSTTQALGSYKAKMPSGNALGNFTDISGSIFTFTGVLPALTYSGVSSMISGSLPLDFSANGLTYSGGTALNEIIVPKRLNYSATDILVSNQFTLTGIIPTINIYEQTDITQYIDRIGVRFQIEGQANIDLLNGSRYVYFDVYEGVTGAGGNVTYPGAPKTFSVAVTAAQSTYNTILDTLSANTKYLIIVRANVSGVSKTLIKNDSATNALAWYYTSTLSNLAIAVTRFDYFARNYVDKGYDLAFTLSQLTGYDIKYTLVRVNPNNSETPVYTHDQLVSGNIITEHQPTAPYSSPYLKTLRFSPGTSLPYGANYKLYITAYAKSDGTYKLGETSHAFTRFTAQPPSFHVNATPERTQAGLNRLTYRVTIADPDKVITSNAGYNWNGLYKVRFYDGQNDITPQAYKDAVYTINASRIFVLDSLADNKGYIIKLYAVYDMNNDAIGDNNVAGINDISSVVLESDLVSPLNGYLKYEKIEKTLDSNGVKLGTVSLAPQAGNRLTVEFSGGVNLDRIALVEYSITDTNGNVMGGPIANPNIIRVSDEFSYLDLPDVLPTAGTYYVTIRFKTADATVIDTLSYVYNRR